MKRLQEHPEQFQEWTFVNETEQIRYIKVNRKYRMWQILHRHRIQCPRCSRWKWMYPGRERLTCNYCKDTVGNEGINHPRYKGTEDIGSTYFSRLKQNAIQRHYRFDITIEDLQTLLKKQNYKCALTGMDIAIYATHNKEWTASVDRIDNTQGYTLDNIQWVHRDINWMKQEFHQDYFKDLCKKVTNYGKESQ